MVNQQSFITLEIAKKVISNKDLVVELFNYGTRDANAQQIKLWLEFAIPKLGFRKVVRLIKKLEDENPNIVSKSVYWLPMFIKTERERELFLKEFKAEDK